MATTKQYASPDAYEAKLARLRNRIGQLVYDAQCEKEQLEAQLAPLKAKAAPLTVMPNQGGRYACPACGRMYWERSFVGEYCDLCGQHLSLPAAPEKEGTGV